MDFCPNCGYVEVKANREELRQIIKGWKILTGIDPDDKNWDRVHFPRLSKSAKSLLCLFGFDGAIDCMEYVFNHMKKENLDCTLETIVKRSDLYRERIAKRGNHGILSS